jgi:tetrapyrrole methylase family protein/MazG family protein/ATP diphosphatase
LLERLRHPEQGCPWDRQQTFSTIAPYTIEEAYEVADAIEHNDLLALKDELGDLLFQVVFHARMAEEKGGFAFGDVVQAISDKMESRHPHVFGTQHIETADQQATAWEQHKQRERAAKNKQASSVLDDVPVALPALTRAAKLGRRAATVGFEWPDVGGALNKTEEEVREVRAAIEQNTSAVEIEDELGDLLFCVVNLCRHTKVDPEAALRKTNLKFERRFRYVESSLQAQGRTLQDSTLEEMDRYWDEAKRLEKQIK